MCFSDRLSNHNFWANFTRLLISSIAYEMFLILKGMIKKTVKRIYFQFSKSFVYQKLFEKLIFQ